LSICYLIFGYFNSCKKQEIISLEEDQFHYKIFNKIEKSDSIFALKYLDSIFVNLDPGELDKINYIELCKIRIIYSLRLNEFEIKVNQILDKNKTNNFIKAYSYIFLGQVNTHFKNYTSAILNYRAGQKLLEKEPNKYVSALSTLIIKEATLWSSYFDQNEHSIELQQKALKYCIKYNSLIIAIKCSHNLSVLNIKTQNYHEAIQYSRIALQFSKLENNYLQTENYVNLLSAYAHLNQADSVKYLLQFYENEYKQNKIQEGDFRFIQLASLEYDTLDVEIEAKLKILTNYYQESCQKRYFLSLIYNYQAIQAKKYGDINLQKKLLQKCIEILECGTLNDYYTKMVKNTVIKLIQIDSSRADYKSIYALQTKLLNINTGLIVDEKKINQTLRKYSENELALTSEQLMRKTEIEQKNKIILFILILSTIFSIISIYYIAHLYRNVKSNKNILKSQKLGLEDALKKLELNNEELLVLNAKNDDKNTLISKQNTELNLAITKLQEINKNLSHFAHMAAHDMNAPLYTINGYLKRLLTKHNDHFDPTDKEHIGIILAMTDNLQSMIDGILILSNLNNEKFLKKIMNFEAIINNVKRNLSAKIIESNAIIHFPKKLPKILGHQSLIEQLFSNLIINSIKFKKEGTYPEIFINWEHINKNIILWSFKDNGIGLEESDKEKVFELFTKINTVPHLRGTGIGLTICKKIVEIHEGEIWLESIKDEGTTFYFTMKMDVKSLENTNKIRKTNPKLIPVISES
jgi:signal transduction histidine kinase